MIFKLLIFILILCTNCVRENNILPFEAGTGVVDITPPVGYPRYGYPSEKSTGVLDPLMAKAIVFKQGEVQGAILICNLLAIPRDLSRIVREKASSRTGIPFQNISISATHTHTSPRITKEFKEYALREMSGMLTEEDQSGYFTFLINGMTEAIVSAYNNTDEVDLYSGIGEASGITFNRRYLMTDGRVRFNPGRNNSNVVRPAGPVDPDVHFVFLQSKDNEDSSASFTVFASHYVRGGSEFSSDYPYYLQERMKEVYGEKHISVFGLGACGNINTVDINKDSEDINIKVKEFGNTLAEAVKKAHLNSTKSVPDFDIINQTIYLPIQDYTEHELKWSKEDSVSPYQERAFLTKRRKLKISVWGVQPPLEQLRLYEAVPPAVSGEPWYLPVEIQIFKLDSQTAIVTMPGELFTEFSIDLKNRSPFSNTMLVELSNADIAYIPTIQGFNEGDYEAVNSRLVPGAGEKMIDTALELLKNIK